LTTVRLGALAGTWLAASIAAGIGSSIQGFVPGVAGDGTVLGTLDATLGWLLVSLVPSALLLIFFFLPVVAFLEWRNIRKPLPFLLGGALAGALPMAVWVAPTVYAQWVPLLLLPGMVAGLAWWFLAIRPSILLNHP
jgi:hypothetical protein